MKYQNKYKRTLKVSAFLLDIMIYHVSFLISFLVRYEFTLPTFNYRAYQNVFPYIILAFGLLNVLSGMYVLYNKRKADLIYSTAINQILMFIIVTALIFFSQKLAFPRSVIIISSIISTVLLAISRIIMYKVYEKVNGSDRVMVIGTEENCQRVIRNFEEIGRASGRERV